MTISQRIFFELKKQNKTQKQLAEYTGISTSTISAWNKNGTNPSADSLYSISQFLNVSLEYLLVGNEYSKDNTSINNSGNIINGSNGNNSPLTVQNEEPTEMEKEISSLLSGMSYRERTELMCLIYKFVDEHK